MAGRFEIPFQGRKIHARHLEWTFSELENGRLDYNPQLEKPRQGFDLSGAAEYEIGPLDNLQLRL
jgi:hypothetical protein